MSVRNAKIDFNADGSQSIEIVTESGQRVVSWAADWPATLAKLDQMTRQAAADALVLPGERNEAFRTAYRLDQLEKRLAELEGAGPPTRVRSWGS